VFTLINIGGVNVIPKDGFTIDRNKLEERDSGNLSTFNTRAERFEPYDLVTIQDIDEQFVVQADNVIRLRDGLYEHDITLVEAISRFDGFYPADRIFSAEPTPKTLGQILDVYKTELSKYHNLEITWDEQADWTTTLIRQKEFVGVNFGVIVADLFRVIDAKPRARFDSGAWEIYPDFYNERRNLITPNPVADLLAQDSLDYATRVKTQLKNGTYESARDRVFPSSNGSILPKSEGPIKIDSKLQYTLDSGIIDIIEMKVFDITVRQTSQGITSDIFTVSEVDISDFVVAKPFWDGLETPANQIADGNHKKNTLFYDIGGRHVKNLFISESEVAFFIFPDNNRILKNAIFEKLWQDDYEYTFGGQTFKIRNSPKGQFSIKNEEDTIKARFKYIPQRSLDLVHHRQYLKNMNEATQIHRQRDSQTDVQRYKNVLKNLSNRMGNDIKQFTQVFTTTDPFDLGDYDVNDNVIVRVKNTFYNDYILSEYILAEGFGNIDGEASLWKEPSAFEILGKDITTNLIIEEFVEVSETSKTVSTRLNEDGQLNVLATLDSSITPNPPIQAAVMQPITDTATLVSASGVYLPAFTGGGGNTTSFHFQIDDPISAGRAFSDTFDDPRFGLDLIYTEPDTSARFGELDDFFIYLIPDVDFTDDGFYPLIPAADVNSIKGDSLTLTNVVDTINKDKNAKFAVTFQQHFITDDPNIIIGAAFAKYNRLFSSETLPAKKIYRSDKPYSIFDNKVRATDTLVGGGFSVNPTTRKLTVSANAIGLTIGANKHVAITYNDEIILAFNDFTSANREYFINFTDAAEREIVNQLPTPSSFGSSSTFDSLSFALTNLSTEGVTIEATLNGVTLTEQAGANDGDPLNIAQYTRTFTFTGLDPNTSYQLSYRALPLTGSDFVASTFGVVNASTTIIPTDLPVATENFVTVNDGVIIPFYNIVNTNDFAVEVFARVDGFEFRMGDIAANSNEDLAPLLTAPQENVVAGVEYDVEFKFRTTEFTNNWDSDYTQSVVMFIGQLDNPIYNHSASSAGSGVVSFNWSNPNNVATQITVELHNTAAAFQSPSTLIETKTVNIGANAATTIVFTNNITPETGYSTAAKLLESGFRLESEVVKSTPNVVTPPPTTATPSITFNSRTTNSVTFTLTNNDGSTADVYYNTTGNPDVGDLTVSQLGSGQPAQRTISGLASGADVTVFARAKATNKLISGNATLPTKTLFQQQQPNFGASSVTQTTITVSYGNPNSLSGNIRVRLNKLLTGGGKTFVEDKFATIDPNGNNNANPFVYSGLDQNSNYELESKFLEDDFKLESTTRVNNLSTTQFKSQDPTVVINDITPTSVNFTMTNNDNLNATFEYGVALPLGQHPAATVGAFGSLTRGISSLDSATNYTLQVRAIADNYAASDVVSIPFTTDPAPVPTQWVFRSATTPDETLNRGFVPTACPTSSSNLTYLNGQIDPSTKPFGYVVRVTSSSESGGFPIECTDHYYEAQ
jgi:hypothetical protein